ncbi:MAG TPA: DUF2092 domain-containing protein [Steroidobacteraceae bacterium]|jgi:hypothetical protein
MTRASYVAVLSVGFSALLLAGLAQSQASKPAPQPPAPGVEATAIAALNKMGAYLRTLKAFQVKGVSSTDDVTDDGQLLESDAVSDVLAQAPNKLRVEVTRDDQHRIYYYNGKSITVYGAHVNYYATVAAPPTISQLADELYDKYGIDLPLQDLFTWGTSRSEASKITAGFDAGPSQIQGVTCEQYAFRQEGLDWQIWIQSGDYPLPRKIVLTTTSDPARPRHSVVLTWNLAPSFNDAAFDFDPPKDAHKIAIAEVRPSAAEKQK